MKTYILTIKQKSGLLTPLQSDTIYGHFCWRLKENLGEQKLLEFLNFYKNGNPIFLLSDGLLRIGDEIQFPRPFIFESPKLEKNKYGKVLGFIDNKLLKERTYLKIDELNEFIKTGKIEIKSKELNSNQEVDSLKRKSKTNKQILLESLRVSVQIDRKTYGSMEGRLFSYKPIHTREDVLFSILIKVLDENKFIEFSIPQILKDTFKIGFGKKKSSGYGQFDIVDLNEFEDLVEISDGNAFMVLGNYLPSIDDSIIPLGYDINTKYGKFGETLSLSDNPFKFPIVFLTAGSCFQTSSQKKFFGRITNEKEISDVNEFAVQFGMPFIIRFNFNK